MQFQSHFWGGVRDEKLTNYRSAPRKVIAVEQSQVSDQWRRPDSRSTISRS